MAQPWYPFFWTDYSGKTLHLTITQHGAYMLLLRWIYTTGKPVPDKHRYSIARAALEAEHEAVDFVLAEFFRKTPAGWVNDRATEVMAEADAKHQAVVAAGKKGGEESAKRRSSGAQAALKQPQPQPESYGHKKKEIRNGILNGSKNGIGRSRTTISDPRERMARFQSKIAKALGADGWTVVADSLNIASGTQRASLRVCKGKAEALKKGSWVGDEAWIRGHI